MLKLRVKFRKYSFIKYISHLDLIRLFARAFRRAGIPVEYSEGYNPKPKFSLATALALGLTSDCEYMDIELKREIKPSIFIKNMNEILPEGVEILDAKYTEDKKSLMSIIKSSDYLIKLNLLEKIDKEDIEDLIEEFKSKEDIFITKTKRKKGRLIERKVDIRSHIYELELVSYKNNEITLKALLETGSSGNLKPELLIKSLIKEGLKVDSTEYKIHRLGLFAKEPIGE